MLGIGSVVRHARAWALGALALGAVSACDMQSKSAAYAPAKMSVEKLEPYLDKLAKQKVKAPAGVTTDFAALAAAMPATVKLSYGAVETGAAGETVVKDLRITPADNTEVGVSVAELKLWGFDTGLAIARLKGERLEETAPLARRIEAKTIALFGLEVLMQPATDAYVGAVNDMTQQMVDDINGAAPAGEELASPEPPLAEDAPAGDIVDEAPAEDSAPEIAFNIDEYQFTIDSLMINDVVLKPYELKLVTLPEDDDFAEVLPFLQQIAAVSRAFAYDAADMKALTAKLAFSETIDGKETGADMELTMARYGLRGSRGGDLDVGLIRDVAYKMAMTFPTDDGVVIPMEIAGKQASSSFEGVRVDKLMGFLVRGVMPPRTETDLLSGGLWRTTGEAMTINGHQVYSLKSSEMDLTGFHWLVPTRLKLSAEDAVWDIGGFTQLIAELVPEGEFPPEAQATMNQVVATLASQQLDKPSFDMVLGWDWKAETGPAALQVDFGIDNAIDLRTKLNFSMPDFNSMASLFPEGATQADDAAMQALMEKKLTFDGFTLDLVDEGGLAKGFLLAVEFAKMTPEEGREGPVAYMAGASPERLRQSASSFIYAGAHEAAKEFPPAKAWMDAFAGFVAKGGTFHAESRPKTPILLAEMEAKASDDPKTFVTETLGVAVTHTPPPEAKKAGK